MRKTIENIIKEFNLDRTRIFEVSHLKYNEIIKKVESKFVRNSGELHWSNLTNRFNPSLSHFSKSIGKNPLWFQHLDKFIPDTLCYVLFEDCKSMKPKYWLYEMYPKEIIIILNESSPKDFYIVSKKFDWLISECHEDIVVVVGTEMNITRIERKLKQLLK